MRKLIDKFYLNNVTLIISFIGTVLGWIAWGIVGFSDNEMKLGVFSIVISIITISLFVAYVKGETSIQKLLFGSLYIFLIVDLIEIIFVYSSLTDIFGISYVIIVSIIFAMIALAYICHILQQSDHVGKSVSYLISQLLGLVMILWIVFLVVAIVKGLVTNSDITFVIGIVFTAFMLICMETRIKVYKQIRTEKIKENNWNDQTRKEAKKLFKL